MKQFKKQLYKNKNIYLAVIVVALLSLFLYKYAKQMDTQEFKEREIENGDITFYGRDSCPFCVKMKKQLEDDGLFSKLDYVDVETQEGHEAFSQIKVSGVPHFECKSTGKSSTGFKPTDSLLNELDLT